MSKFALLIWRFPQALLLPFSQTQPPEQPSAVAGIGEQAVMSTNPGSGRSLKFKKGNTVMVVRIIRMQGGKIGDKAGDDTLIQQIAQTIAGRL